MEMLVVVAILVMLSSMVTVAFGRFARNRAVESAASLIAGELADARSRTLAARSGISHGVHLDESGVVLFGGSTYDAGDLTNEATVLDSRTIIAEIDLNGGGDDIVFERLTGETDAYGTITVAASSDPTIVATLTVQQTGLISIE